jgi:3-methylfumaryl-CoA hydratase
MTERAEVRVDVLTPRIARQFADTFDQDPLREPAQGVHWCLCPPEAATRDLSADGHLRRGHFMPESELECRMWAGSDVTFHRPLNIGSSVERRSQVGKVERKMGASGPLMFVTIEHDIRVDGVLSIQEKQSVVYRASGQNSRPPINRASEPARWSWRREIAAVPPLLFRYSALTFNSHRIHYDRRWATQVEGYSDLVVHGPLLATMLLDLVDRSIGPHRVHHFSFRAVSPALVEERLFLLGNFEPPLAAMSVQTSDGRETMTAQARCVTDASE